MAELTQSQTAKSSFNPHIQSVGTVPIRRFDCKIQTFFMETAMAQVRLRASVNNCNFHIYRSNEIDRETKQTRQTGWANSVGPDQTPREAKQARQTCWANSVGPDQTPHDAASDRGLHCLPVIQQF